MTYSIAAVDTATGEVGGAGASCVGSLSVRVIYGSVPGAGVVHAQAQLGGPGRDRSVMLIEDRVAPDEIVAMITAPGFDGNAQRRQYGVVDLELRSAGFTGSQNGMVAGDVQGAVHTFAYSVQGNILTGMTVLDRSAAGFEDGGCDLADRLMRALEAGARDGHGDSRCTPRGVAADSAFLEVDRPGEAAGTYLRLEVTDTGAADPIAMLRGQYDTWRAMNPCPVVAADAGAGAPDEMAAGCCSSAADPSTMTLPLALAVAMLVRRTATKSARRSSRTAARCARASRGWPRPRRRNA